MSPEITNVRLRSVTPEPKRCPCGVVIPTDIDECDVCYDRALVFEASYAEEKA